MFYPQKKRGGNWSNLTCAWLFYLRDGLVQLTFRIYLPKKAIYSKMLTKPGETEIFNIKRGYLLHLGEFPGNIWSKERHPIGYMYGLYGICSYTYHKNQPNVCNISCMGPIGITLVSLWFACRHLMNCSYLYILLLIGDVRCPLMRSTKCCPRGKI